MSPPECPPSPNYDQSHDTDLAVIVGGGAVILAAAFSENWALFSARSSRCEKGSVGLSLLFPAPSQRVSSWDGQDVKALSYGRRL